MQMILDPETQKLLKTASKLGNFDGNVIGNFSDVVPNSNRSGQQKKALVINDPDSVRLMNDKKALFETMAAEGYPMPDFATYSELYDEALRCLDIDEYDQKFGFDAQNPVTFRTPRGSFEIESYDELLNALHATGDEKTRQQSVFYQPNGFEEWQLANVTAAPGMAGRKMHTSAGIVDDGIFRADFPKKAPICMEMLKMTTEVGLFLECDYFTLSFIYNEDKFLITNASGSLIESTIECVSCMVTLMLADKKKK